MDNKYNASSIEVLTGLDPVRKRPGMYTDTQNPNHIVQEVVDNSIDEAIAGHASYVRIELFNDHSIKVTDDGRGMPVDEHPEQKRSAVEVILTTLHSGGKFSNDNYKYSGGLHGVGISVVNALCSRLAVEVKRDGYIYELDFIDGMPQGQLQQVGKATNKKTGTTVTFTPNEAFFVTGNLDIKSLKKYLQAKAVLCPGIRVSLNIEATEENIEWHYATGLTEYLAKQFEQDTIFPNELFSHHLKTAEGEVEFAIGWTAEMRGSVQESYVNAIMTLQGGTHVNGLRAGITDALREFCEFQNLLTKQTRITPDDVWQNAVFVLSVKLTDPQFVGQTKEKLSSREATGLVSNIAKDGFSLWLNQHVEAGRLIAELIINIAKYRLRSTQKIIRKKVISGPALPGKLTDCLSDNLDQTELFLVEGDSAGGSAKQARDKNFQAILPLRGKILNTWEVEHDQILSSDEIHAISVAIGLEPNSWNLSNLRYGKVCILADADSDGLHIATLLCALFVRHFRHLVDQGHVYVAMPPLYRVDIGKETFYALDSEEHDQIIEKNAGRAKPVVTRFKGLGEMNPKQLKESTMHPESRRLVQLTIEEGDDTLKLLDMLLAKKRSPDRKQWLEDRGDLAVV